MEADGTDERRLTDTMDRFAEMTPGGWTPDSSAIVYTSRELYQDEGPEPDDRLAVASFGLGGAIAGIVLGLLFAVGLTFPLGATLAFLLAFGILPLAFGEPRWVPAAVFAGLVTDGAAWLLRRRPQTTVQTAGLAALGAVAWSIAFFIVGGQTGDMRWEFNLLSSSVVIAGLAAFAAAAAIASGRARTAQPE
jgi:hypothetical protein